MRVMQVAYASWGGPWLGVRGRYWRQPGHQVRDQHPGRLSRSGLLESERAWVIQDCLQVLLPGDEHPVGNPPGQGDPAFGMVRQQAAPRDTRQYLWDASGLRSVVPWPAGIRRG